MEQISHTVTKDAPRFFNRSGTDRVHAVYAPMI